MTTDLPHRERVLHLLALAAGLIFFQSYLVAPLIPALTAEFHSTQKSVGLLIPAYMLPYGISTLFYGPIADRFGRSKILLTLIGLMVLTTAGIASAQTIPQMLFWRVLAGVATGGVIPIALALLADLFPYAELGHAFGWLFGAIAGGMAFGSTFGALLNPILGWRNVFLLVAAAELIVFIFSLANARHFHGESHPHQLTLRTTISAYIDLLKNRRGLRTYFYTFANGMFHSGVFSWLGAYFFSRYHFNDTQIGLALLGYGIPGLLLGPVIGKFADRIGRRTLIPAGLLLASLSAVCLIPHTPYLAPAIACTFLSLGYDMSHPLLAGIITSLNPQRRGQAVGLNAFILFTGFGTGSLLFQSMMATPDSFTLPLSTFSCTLFALGLLAIRLFQMEAPNRIIPNMPATKTS